MAVIPRRQPLVNPNQRQLDSRTYNESVNRLKGMQQGTDLYNKNFDTVQKLGTQYGWNWQQYKPQQATTTPPPAQQNPAPTTTTTTTAPTTTTTTTASPWMSLDRNNAAIKYREADNRIKSGRFQPGTPEYDKNMKILSELGAKFGWKYQDTVGNWKPTQAPSTDQTPAPDPGTTPPVNNTPAPGPSTDPAPATPAAPASGTDTPMTQMLLQALQNGMSTVRAYEPQNFEGSPMYQFQKQKGLQDLEKLMAARGLTGSGAEIQANSDFLSQLGASESEKQRQYAQGDMDRTMGGLMNVAGMDQNERRFAWDQRNADLDRRINMQQFEAGRGDANRSRDMNFLTQILGLQAQNPIADQSFRGTGASTDLTKALIDSMAQFTANNYDRQVPSGGGGGAGLPPPPPGSNANLDLMREILNYGNKADNQGLLGTILSQFAR